MSLLFSMTVIIEHVESLEKDSDRTADELEKLDGQKYAEANPGLLATFCDVLNRKSEPCTRPEKKLQAQILSEMMAIDAPRAAVMMKSWATFVQSASRVRTVPFDTLEEYVPARVIDSGEL
jgi:hypothetical protein